ncbi:MAG: Fic family protein [Gammaproteobacteria bacterium]|nr:Fic family protein [Gammaproteobacteria bacterium]
MAKRIPQDEADDILKIVAQFSEGVAVDQVHTRLAKPVPRRTLQYRLAKLVADEKLQAIGKGRGRRYRLPVAVAQNTEAEPVEPPDEFRLEKHIVVSEESGDISRKVREPLQSRNPVGYQRQFLEDYRPNETFYLPLEIRRKLMALGHSPGDERPAGTYARQIYNRLLIDLTWNSSRLEGNTYSLLETELLLEIGESAEGKNAREAQMILNHKAAIELLVDQAGESGFSRHMILSLHALLSDNLLDDAGAGGRLRNRIAEIGGSVFHPLGMPQLIEECFHQLLNSVSAIEDPFEQAFFIMVHLPYLQPFDDVNKRVSRLAANIPFIRHNLSPLSFIDVPERAYVDGLLGVYELNRVELLRDVFVWAYERSCARYSAVAKTLGEPDPFRLRYRGALTDTVAQVVLQCMRKKSAAAFLQQYSSEKLPEPDQRRFVEVAETELMSLHEGNIARYRLRPSEYRAWQENW